MLGPLGKCSGLGAPCFPTIGGAGTGAPSSASSSGTPTSDGVAMRGGNQCYNLLPDSR
ncbi:UNVERIFIED_CONTAM: hypothetical protein Slati_2966700 [Sesamum latifolium]|uniref:Uncharacterized protein n=1 Tax=Sesamum latifolium TaxID=2727402 RepID=A0AAW2VG07_9LAMI